MTRTDPFDRLRHALSAVFRTSAPRGQESGGPSDGQGDLSLLEQDLDASFAEVEADLRASRDLLVLERLLLVLHRRVPVSAVRKSPVEGTGRISFANGTSVIATTRPAGHLSQLAVAVIRGRVLLESARAVDDGVEMIFALKDGRRFTAYAIGLDQED
jgi:hypothetical protein